MSGSEARTSGKEPRPPDRAELVRLVREVVPEAEAIWLYGSFADGTARADSDLDLALLADPPLSSDTLFERTLALVARLGRPVHLVDLGSASTVLRFEVVSRSELLWAVDRFEAELKELVWIAIHQDETARRRLVESRS